MASRPRGSKPCSTSCRGGCRSGIVICSARTYTRDYQDVVAAWLEAGVQVWGSVPERVSIAAGPENWLAEDGLEAYRTVWRRAQRAVRER